MKKSLLLILFATVLKLTGQVYNAGTFFSVYTDINPDKLIRYTVTPYTNQTYSVDVFGSSQSDIEFTAHGSVSSSGSSAYIKVSSVNPDVYISFGRWDSVFVPAGPNWNVTKVAKPLTLGEQINTAGAIWDNTTLYFTDHSGFGGGNKNVNDWVGGEKFLGLKYTGVGGTTYGWIKVQCTSEDSCYIKDMSHTPQTTGIRPTAKEGLKVYPNPVSTEIYLDLTQSDLDINSLKLVDALGKEVKFVYEIKDKKIRIDLDKDLPEGVYLLQYRSGEASFVKKVVKTGK